MPNDVDYLCDQIDQELSVGEPRLGLLYCCLISSGIMLGIYYAIYCALHGG